ncbi:ATP-binding cassette domain-containing protein [Nocardioides sp. dk4132]|uniref:sulfate/molybdate ABC transporter ATP-binding protein n=1 Tax=unclassified Nocardioides TaxID=2615069 RepID=UPI0012963A4F|nr:MULTISPECIES: ATP-binding cassette domain-containing protein [unclassified Nocardioides]MQW75806.1 ATP-binding cassette domain-containing protein [Nocardioides sp. dk4132]QGA08682.1 ATP-binding cassette domain-containing protein [Nocardioides sp. dk884]
MSTAPVPDTRTGLEVDVRVDDRDLEAALSLAPGETLAVLGPNGAGKSTLLATVAGLLRPDRGRVRIGGREVSGPRTWLAPHQRRVALLSQDPLLFPHLDVLDNVAFGPRSAGTGRRAAREVAHRWLVEVGVEDLASRRPASLSGGQAQRVAVARALAAEPDLLLLDEPMAALDVSVAPALRQVLRRVLAERSTVLVTHDVLDALLLADRVVVLDGGRVVEDGATTEVLTRPRSAFAARVAGLNLLSGRWEDGVRTPEGRLVHGSVVGPQPAPGQEVVAVFRPEAVSVFDHDPGGSPRNVFEATITELEPVGGVVRVRAGALAADVTTRAVPDLDLVPGSRATFTVKATEVSVYLASANPTGPIGFGHDGAGQPERRPPVP